MGRVYRRKVVYVWSGAIMAASHMYKSTHTDTNSYMTRQITDAQEVIKQFLSVLKIVIFVQNVIKYVWLKRKFVPRYDI